MKLTAAQFVLEEAHFAHKTNFLERQPSDAIPQAPVDLEIEVAHAQDNPAAKVVRLRVVSKAPEAVYDFRVSYIVILMLDMEGEDPPGDLDKRLMVTGATMLFPFVREAVANLTSRGRFGPSWMQPVNFNDVVARINPPPPPVAANVR